MYVFVASLENQRYSVRMSLALSDLNREKYIILLNPTSYGLNGITTVLLQGWLWH